MTLTDLQIEHQSLSDAEQFVRDIIKQSWDGSSDVDGGWLQDEAAKRGFIVEVKYDPVVHGEMDDVDPGEPAFVLSDRLKSGGRGRAGADNAKGGSAADYDCFANAVHHHEEAAAHNADELAEWIYREYVKAAPAKAVPFAVMRDRLRATLAAEPSESTATRVWREAAAIADACYREVMSGGSPWDEGARDMAARIAGRMRAAAGGSAGRCPP